MNNMKERRMFEEAQGREVAELRDRYTKHYDLGEGRYQAISYAEPVHFEQNGAWMEIDNRLDERVLKDGRHVLANRNSAVKMRLAERADDGVLVELEHKGRKLGWSFETDAFAVGAQTIQGEVLKQARMKARADRARKCLEQSRVALAQQAGMQKEGADQAARLEEAMNALEGLEEQEQEKRLDLSEWSSEVRYEGMLPGVSVKYTLDGERLKEDIIVKEREALKYVKLKLPPEYEYEKSEDGWVTVRDSESREALFYFAAPYAYDSGDGAGVPVKVSLERLEGYVRMGYELEAEYAEKAVYPVTIDPIAMTQIDNSQVEDTYLRQKYPDKVQENQYLLEVGYADGKENKALIRFKKLIKQRASDTIIYAGLRMYPISGQNSNEYMACYPIKKNWSAAKATWNKAGVDAQGNAVAVSHDELIGSEVLDFVDTTNVGYQEYNITNLYRSWYKKKNGASQNFGVALQYPKGVSSSSQYVQYASVTYEPGSSPRMVINYVSHAGVQGWWQYEEQSAGRAGTGYVDLYNGNLVLEHRDTAMNGARTPVSVTHWYNSCLSESNEVCCGCGWRTSMHQSVRMQNYNGTDYYVWQDGSGTEHYFKKAGSEPYKDAEGQDLELRVNDNSITITDKGDNKMAFPKTSKGKVYLSSVQDAQKNRASLTYSDAGKGKIDKITDPAGRVTRYEYNESGDLLKKICAEGCPEVNFEYEGGRLTRVWYSDLGSGSKTEYGYEGNLLTGAKNHDGLTMTFGYEPEGEFDQACISNFAPQARKVTEMEVRNGSEQGAKRLIEYKGMESRVRAVEGTGSEQGKELIYQFNDNGNVVSVRDELGYAQFTKYESGTPNSPKAESKLRKVVMNRVKGAGLGSSWSAVMNGGSGSAGQDTETRCLGLATGKVVSNGESGEVIYRSAAVKVEKGKEWTFSAYVKTGGLTGSGGARVRLKTADGKVVKASRMLRENTAEQGGTGHGGWARLSATIALAGTGEAEVICEVVIEKAKGTAHFGCVQLEEGRIANRVNLLRNGDFRETEDEQVSGGTRKQPVGWNARGGITESLSYCVEKASDLPEAIGGNVLRMFSFPGRDEVGYEQVIYVKGKKGDVYTIGGWAKGQPAAVGSGEKSQYGLKVQFYKSSTEGLGWKYYTFNKEWVGWQYGSWAISAPGDYVMLKVIVDYRHNANTAYFTNLFVHKERFGKSYGYDENKNLVSVANLANLKKEAEYDKYDNLLSYRRYGAGETEKYTYSYGSTDEDKKKHLLRGSKTPEGVCGSYAYDGYGNETARKVHDGKSGIEIRTTTEYDGQGNYVKKRTDALGRSTAYETDAKKGTLSKVTDAKGQSVSYGYDSTKRVTSVQASAGGKTCKNEYTYAKDRLSEVKHNTTGDGTDVRYSFSYDGLGRQREVKVDNPGNSGAGSQLLSRNVYDANDRSGKLKRVEYGNGGKVNYTYDEFDRLIGVSYDGATTPRYEYEYGASGETARVTDKALNRAYESEYDLAERPMEGRLTDGNGNLLYQTVLKYNGKNELSQFQESWNGQKYLTKYTYDKDGRTRGIQYEGTTAQTTYAYDAAGRLSKRKITNGGNGYYTEYGYSAGNNSSIKSDGTSAQNGTHSTQVNRLNQPGEVFEYGYDAVGNIVSEKRNGAANTYAYDGLGQLTRANLAGQASWVYEYDRGGNIISKKKYAYTTGALGAVQQTIAYEYGNAKWKDQLTKYNGKAITYDAIGNPLSYNGWTYEWQAGRQLKKMSKSGTTAEYTYDHNGLRVRKVVNGVATEYMLHGKLVTGVKKGSDILKITYDAESRPAMVKYNGTWYGYVHNLQGDIVGILDNTGAEVVKYTYDAWGKVISVSGSKAGTLGKANPFRYRGYVYDEETGLYYLRSRYYDPEWGRFINADMVIGTIGSLTSFNGYSYCSNIPICCSDKDGDELEWDLLPYPGYIHKQVQAHIKLNQIRTAQLEFMVKYDTPVNDKPYGFVDVFDPATGYVWEVKPVSQGSAVALAQLGNYFNSKEARINGFKKGVGICTSTFFTENGQFQVRYFQKKSEPGVILYTFKYVRPQEESSPQDVEDTIKALLLLMALFGGKFLLGKLGGALAFG